MDSLVGYGSDDEVESDRIGLHQSSVGGTSGAHKRRDDDTNYDDVNMDMSEDSGDAESEPELPQAEPAPAPSRHGPHDRRGSDDNRDRPREREERRDRRRETPGRSRPDRESPGRSRPDRDSPGRSRPDRESPVRSRSERDSPSRRPDRERGDRRSPRRDDRYRSDRNDRGRGEGVRREDKVPALMELRPFGGAPPPGLERRPHDHRDAVSPRFSDRDRRDRDRDRERDRDRHNRHSEEKRLSSHRHDRRERSRSRGAAFPPPAHHSNSGERRGSPPSGDYRPSSYKVNKKLEVMEKMGLQIKTPDGSMATAQQLRAAAGDLPPGASLPSYYNPSAVNTNKILDQVQKRKLLWSGKNKSEAEEASKWSGTRFAQDNDGKQVSKFMRLMGIKEPAAMKPEPVDTNVDPIKKQEELFQAMQAQYEVARATTHTMRGVGLGFQRGQF